MSYKRTTEHETAVHSNNMKKGFPLVLILMMVPAVTSLVCFRAEYQVGEACCPRCPPGTRVNKHCTELRSVQCLPCDEDTYMDEPTGETHCLLCRTCPSGSGLKVKTACSSSSNAVCEAQEGHFCVEEEEGSSCRTAQRHESCEPGEFIQKPGNEDTGCQPHTQCEMMGKATVKEGTSNSDAECGEKRSRTFIIGFIVIVVLAASVVVFLYMKKNAWHATKPTGDDSTPVAPENVAMKLLKTPN